MDEVRSRLHRWGRRVGLGLGLGLAGCGGGAQAISSRVGEVHLHQYSTGAHIEALFVDPPTPIEQTEFDSALPSRNQPILQLGLALADCKVYAFTGCGGGCPSPAFLDGGRVDISGLPRAVSMAYIPQFGSYEDVAVDGVFVPGALLSVRGEGSARVPPFSAELAGPVALVPTSTLENGLSAGLEVGWTSVGDGSRLKVVVSVVPTTGTSGAVSCYVDETLGRFRLPDEALALLAPPPRTVELEVSRFRLLDASLGDGRSVVVHSGYSVLSATMEP